MFADAWTASILMAINSRRLACFLAVLSSALVAHAQVAVLDPIVVTGVASRIEESVDDTPATLSVITRRDLDRALANTLRDAIRYEPGVSIENGATRFGFGSIAIRGLEGNRVQILYDGIRMPDQYKIGSFSRNINGVFNRNTYISSINGRNIVNAIAYIRHCIIFFQSQNKSLFLLRLNLCENIGLLCHFRQGFRAGFKKFFPRPYYRILNAYTQTNRFGDISIIACDNF